jgi:hypothetical protein
VLHEYLNVEALRGAGGEAGQGLWSDGQSFLQYDGQARVGDAIVRAPAALRPRWVRHTAAAWAMGAWRPLS